MTTLSPQQAAVKLHAQQHLQNLIVEAVAGAGKTFTLIEILKILEGNVAFMAFNKSIAEEIDERIKPFNLSNVIVGTIHKFGFGIIRRNIKNIKIDNYKLSKLARQEFQGDFQNLIPVAIEGAEMAKNCMPETYDDWYEMFEQYNIFNAAPNNVSEETAIDAAQHLLSVSNATKNIIDFADMLYFPIVHNMKVWKYDVILLDEAQDSNRARIELIKRMLKPTGKFIAVGDPHQAIYGFTGADSNSLETIKQEFDALTLPLSVTYRCPKKIVEVAQKWVQHITAHESAPEGIVDSCTIQDLSKLVKPEDAIICRNTKPLVQLAYNLIRNEIPCRVEGRKIGEGLVKLIKKWKKVKTVGELSIKLETWAEQQIEQKRAKEKFIECQNIEDQVETIKVFISQCDDSDDISCLVEKIQGLFADDNKGCLTLSTIHKSKGREWKRVFTLGMNKFSPSKWAKKDWEIKQEDNLCYVQVTRAKEHLTIINL